ncbi:MAG: hypothetical protein H7X99_09955 [Saprospiraceae bacterium]|nr:hypothetical protein [Saprospiraceae bacterium]
MKTKTLIFGMVIAIISTLTISTARAQSEPSVKVVHGHEKNSIKVIYGYDAEESVEVKFLTADGILETDIIKGEDFEGGFIKKYNLDILKGNIFWVEVDSEKLSVTFKMVPYKDGIWIAQLEKTTYNHPAVAKR